MKMPPAFWTGLVLLTIGLAGGFVIATTLQGQLALLVYLVVAFAFLSWLGSGADLIGLVNHWYEGRKEEERKVSAAPKLTILFDIKNPADSEPIGDMTIQQTRFTFKRK